MDFTWSATSGRGSVARTIAPSEPAAPMAARPATPAPATSTFAGGILPAAVIWPVKKRPNTFAASMTARYPAMFAIELRTSRDCAREIRGTMSMAMPVTPRSASLSTSSGCRAGLIRLTRVAPDRSSAISSSDGGLTWKTMSAAQASGPVPIVAPAASYVASVKADDTPAPDSTTTS